MPNCESSVRSFHEKADPCQELFSFLKEFLFSVQPSRLSRIAHRAPRRGRHSPGTRGILSDGSVGHRSDILVEMDEVSRVVFRLDLCQLYEKRISAQSNELGTPGVRRAFSLVPR